MSSSHFACALSTAPRGQDAIGEALRKLESRLEGHQPDLVVAYATHHYGERLEGLGPQLARALGDVVIQGCTAESILGDGREVQGSPGLVLWAATLPQTRIEAFHMRAETKEEGDVEFLGRPRVDPGPDSTLVVLADPYTFPIDAFLDCLGTEAPGVTALGGITSGAMGPGQTLFFTPDGVEEAGMQGLSLTGTGSPTPVVSQGCRPIGKPYVITECERNEIKRLGGRPALEVLFETMSELDPCEQRLFQSGPFVGLAVDPTRSTFERGDLLVRGVMGVNHAGRSFSVSAFVRRGQTVQLQVRDPKTAGADLTALVARACSNPTETDSAAGALLFTCLGRGTRMFDIENHDVHHTQEGFGREVPIAGFFASGEIGPVGGRNFLHGFTASVAVF